MAIMGTGIASGPDRARVAATAAVSSPLLEDATVQGARGVIINVTGGPDLTLAEVSDASDIVYSAAHEDANIIFGAVVDPKMEGKVKITVIATGFDHPWASAPPAPPLQQSTKPTPIDLHEYTRNQNEERLVVNGGRVVVAARRPVIEMPTLPLPSDASDTPDAADEPSPFDVPAFMRRQES
jgi:cell division protein FtsZ